ncbi:14022_t:CDS:2 [Acaulospora colombiana]|uniref:14022_t:CDS:1 n=1 Tax=Acaulospora colombiana TaxID=27376 RepID=A0ACA9MIH2_9GLOM|nr:14022_t:CDS:2 [Acaulospora colombiana]
MEVSFALTGKDFVLIAADQNAGRSIIKMKSDEDKIKALGSHLLMSYSGEPAQFEAAANEEQSSSSATSSCILGYDMAEKQPKLYWMDYLGTQSDVPFAAHGYGSYFALSLLDRYLVQFAFTLNHSLRVSVYRYHNPNADLEEGLETLKRCIREVQIRLVVSFPTFKVKVVDENGVREIEVNV